MRFFIPLITLFVFSNSHADNPIEIEMIQSLKSYESSVNSGDLQSAANFFLDSPYFFIVEDGKIRYQTAEAAGKAIKELGHFGKAKLKFEIEKSAAVTDKLGVVYAKFQMQVGEPGKGGFRFSGGVTYNLLKTNTGWKILNGHTSTFK